MWPILNLALKPLVLKNIRILLKIFSNDGSSEWNRSRRTCRGFQSVRRTRTLFQGQWLVQLAMVVYGYGANMFKYFPQLHQYHQFARFCQGETSQIS
jgi:hypothetical protein